MKTGIIGLPQVGKTSLFRILTKAHLSDQARSNPREAHIGVAKVPDDRLDRLAALYNPKKLTHTSVEYVDVGAIGQEALKDTAYSAHLRSVDAFAHVVRVFDDLRCRIRARSIRCATLRTWNSICWSAIWDRSRSGWSGWKKISRR